MLSPWTESHSELCTIFKLNDTANAKLYFARVEFSPADMAKAHLVETYKLKIDEERTPEWFDDEMKEIVTERLTAYIKSIIVDGDVKLLVGGQFIVAPGAKIESAHSMVISAMCGGTLSEMRGGTLSEMWGGTLSEMCGGTLSEMCGGTLSEMCGGTLSEMWGGTLSEMWGGTLSAMCGGTLSAMCGGTLSEMCGGTLSEIKSWFDGLIGKIGKDAKILSDERAKK